MTLLELLAVVTIIGIFVALATPAMSGVLEDRHTGRAADEIANMFRIARSRAAGTGSAHYVRATAGGTTATFELRTALVGVGGPLGTCSQLSWTDADSRVLKRVDLGLATSGPFGGKQIIVRPAAAVGSGTMTATVTEYCYTPGGMPWTKVGGVWTRPSGSSVARFEVLRTPSTIEEGLIRIVRISPSGLPSIEAR